MTGPRGQLARLGLAPSRARGQNFIHDPGLAGRIADLILGQVSIEGGQPPGGGGQLTGRRVVEIGPGLGALTRPLLNRGLSLTVVEVDRGLAAALEGWPEVFEKRLTVLCRDVLTLALVRDLGEGGYLVCGNLPYNLSTPIIFWFMDQASAAELGVFMLQKEMAQRLSAGPGGRDYGRLSVAVSLWYEVKTVMDIPASAFRPRPKVESTLVTLKARGVPPPAEERAALGRLTGAAFASRRKTIMNNLGARYGREKALGALEKLGLDPGLRAERLDPQEFSGLSAILEPWNVD
jgi:16S rRNA (adenine1518-N6/adenine1519-N6)-dimethyltransferase